MALASPTFYRRLAMQSSIGRQASARTLCSRPFSSAVTRLSSGGKLSTDDSVKTDKYPDDQHTTNKTDKLDVQSESSSKGREAKSQGGGGSATSQKDHTNSTSKTKQDHPEAPDVVIGMQDERGGKGA